MMKQCSAAPVAAAVATVAPTAAMQSHCICAHTREVYARLPGALRTDATQARTQFWEGLERELSPLTAAIAAITATAAATAATALVKGMRKQCSGAPVDTH